MEPFFLSLADRIDRSSGVSLATSKDGSASVAVLGTTSATPTARAIAESYARDGRCAVPDVACDVGYVILDHSKTSATVVSAPIGLMQIYWGHRQGSLLLSSSASDFEPGLQEVHTIKPAALFHYVYFHNLPGPMGFREGISKLDGGHILQWSNGRVAIERYWKPQFRDDAPFTEEQAAAELRQLLEDATRRAIGDTPSVGAFLSGGLDSSTVVGFAARARPRIPTISMGFDAAGYDEMQYARTASSWFGAAPLEYYVTPDDVLRTLPNIAAAFSEPFGNSSAAAVFHCARVAKEHGLDLLLAGDGGDEIFGGNARYATQMLFERYSRVPAVVRKRILEPCVDAASRLTTAFPIGKARGYIDKANVPLPDRLQAYNFLHRHDPSDVFAPELLRQVDMAAPLQLLREEFNVPTTHDSVNRMLFMDWKFTLHDNDLVKVNTMCQLAGVQVAYPMLDQALVDFSLKIPGNWKVRNGQLRWFYKRALSDFLPRQVLRKTKHGFGLPFGVWTRSHDGLRRLSEDSLNSLAARGYFKPQFLLEALRLHREGHAAYYGELVWILMALELWLQHHMPNARL